VDYYAHRWHNGEIVLNRQPYYNPANVSSQRRGEAHSDIYTSQRMKAITPKKLAAKIAEENAMFYRLQEMEKAANDKAGAFLKSLEGLPVKYSEDKQRGEIVANGLEYSYEIMNDGYISQKIEVHYSVGNITWLNYTER
jgi:hypothetical protein